MTDEVEIDYQCWHCGKTFKTIFEMEAHLAITGANHGSIYILRQYVNGSLAGEQIGSTTAMRQAHEIEMTGEDKITL